MLNNSTFFITPRQLIVFFAHGQLHSGYVIIVKSKVENRLSSHPTARFPNVAIHKKRVHWILLSMYGEYNVSSR